MADRIDRPRVLMLSHRVPAPVDDPAQQRVWAMVNSLAPVCELWLIAQAANRLHLAHWRQLQQMTGRFELVTGSLGLSTRRAMRRAATAAGRAWTFDATLVTHPALEPVAELAPATFRQTDADAPVGRAGPSRWFRRRVPLVSASPKPTPAPPGFAAGDAETPLAVLALLAQVAAARSPITLPALPPAAIPLRKAA
jgi:hypothetical protein